MKLVYTIKKSWYLFRIGHSIYMTFPLAFVGFIVTIRIYLSLVNIPLLSSLKLWEFTILFSIPYSLICVFIGRLHIRTQNWTETEISAPQSPYEYKIKPFGRDLLLNTPLSLLDLKIKKEMLRALGKLTPELEKEIEKYEKMTETLLKGGEVK